MVTFVVVSSKHALTQTIMSIANLFLSTKVAVGLFGKILGYQHSPLLAETTFLKQTILVKQGKEGNILKDKLSLMRQTRVERAKAKTKEIPSRTNKINTTLIRLDHHPYHF